MAPEQNQVCRPLRRPTCRRNQGGSMRCRQLWSSRLKRWKAIAARFPMPLRARGVRVSSHSVRARLAEASQPQIVLFLSKKNCFLSKSTVVAGRGRNLSRPPGGKPSGGLWPKRRFPRLVVESDGAKSQGSRCVLDTTPTFRLGGKLFCDSTNTVRCSTNI